MITTEFTDLVASCLDGLVSLRDAPSHPRVPQLDMRPTSCRFVVADPARAFVEQAGIADPDTYSAAVSWLDRHGRYEGTRIFQRVDGAAERIDTLFGEPSVPLVHEPVVGAVPDPTTWGDQ